MKPESILDLRILGLSDNDYLRFRDLIEGGCLVTGRPGSGKSSTVARAIALGLLQAGCGGLVLTVKSDETHHWVEYVARSGRTTDLVLFNVESGLRFDPLAYLWRQPGRAGGQIETIIQFLTTLLSIGKSEARESSEGRFFELAVEELMRAVLVILSLAGEPISIVSIHKAITSLPISPQEAVAELKRARDTDTAGDTASMPSYIGNLVSRLLKREATLTQAQGGDLDHALQFAFELWPNDDPKTRSNILSTWTGMASKFTYSPLREMFCSGVCDFSPEETTHKRKIVVVDFPILEFGLGVSRIIQILIKLSFQHGWLRHQFVPGCCNGAFLFQDEFAMLLARNEGFFYQMCRGSAIAPICLTPNINNIAAGEFGESRPGSRTLGFLGNLTVKIFMAQTDVETSKYAASLIGQEYRYLSSYHTGVQPNFGGSEHLANLLEPIEVSRLLTPDGENPYAEAIVYNGGKTFNVSKANYLRVLFSRE